jgi:YbgC/YbaW family acyl-CoA thioester hydrolase
MMATAMPRIRTEVQVMFFDTDCGGVVSNIAYLRFIEIARTLLAEELGLALAEMAETQRYPVVVHTEIDYCRAAKLGDWLVIEGWPRSTGTRAILVRVPHRSAERQHVDCRMPSIPRAHRDASGKIAAFAGKLGKISKPEEWRLIDR